MRYGYCEKWEKSEAEQVEFLKVQLITFITFSALQYSSKHCIKYLKNNLIFKVINLKDIIFTVIWGSPKLFNLLLTLYFSQFSST